MKWLTIGSFDFFRHTILLFSQNGDGQKLSEIDEIVYYVIKAIFNF